MKPPSQSQSSPVFEGVYSNARMLHFLTAVVGSTCDVQVKNGTVYEGIFKTLSSQCDLAVDAVHKCSDGVAAAGEGEGEGGGGGGGGEEGGGGVSPESPPPKMEEITDTMVFSPADLVTMTCRDVDLNYATRDSFTDTAISSSRVNGEHREKVLQRWDAGDSNGESYELEADAANGWDANEMFKSHEETYGVKSTYDSSLSMYTVPLERGNSDTFRQREARAARLATEIESSPQYRRRVSLENTDGKTEEERYSAVLRCTDRDDHRGATSGSPGFSSSGREGRYIPLPQRAREIGMSGGAGARGATGGSGRVGPGSSSSSRHNAHHPPPGSSPSPSSSSSSSSSDRSSPLSVRAAYSPPHQSQLGSSPPPAAAAAPPPGMLPHSLSHPQVLGGGGDAAATHPSVNGVVSRTSPKSQRPQGSRTLRTPNSQSSPAVSRSPRPDSAPSQDLPLAASPAYLDSSPSSVTTATCKPSGPAPLFPVDVNEILSSAAKERMEALVAAQEGKNSKTPSVQQRSQLEELRKFGKEFRLQPSSSSSSPANLASLESSSPAEGAGVGPQPGDSSPGRPGLEQQTAEAGSSSTPTPTPGAPQSAGPDRQSAGTPQLGTEDPCRPDSAERANSSPVAVVQVKNSTLNPNAKEFLPVKGPTVLKPAQTPTPPRPAPPSPSVALSPLPAPHHQQQGAVPQGGGQGPGGGQPGGGAIYSSPPGPYLSYVFPNSIQGHAVQAPQMYQYMSTVAQSKYPRAKGPVVMGPPRADHHASQTQASMMQAAATAAGAPLVASPYQPYLQYGQLLQAMPPHYHGQPMYSMLQGGARMLTSPQAMQGPPGPPQYPGQPGEGPQGPQQAMYAPQAFSHHAGSMHHPQPSSTPTGSQPQHTAPSPGHTQAAQGGPQPQSMYHSGGLSGSTPPSLPPGHSSPQASYPMQGYSLQTHQHMAHGFPSIGQLTQAHVAGGMTGPHHHSAGPHGPPPPQVMLHYAAAPQQGGANAPQHGPPPQQGTHQHYYIGHPQALQMQTHPGQQLSFHPAGN